MIRLSTDVLINSKTPEEVYTWWLGLNNERYTLWHKEHIFWTWDTDSKSVKDRLGAKVHFGEKIGDYKIEFKGKVCALKENEYIRFQHSYLPVSVAFTFCPSEGGCLFHYELTIGFSGPLSRVFDSIIRTMYPEVDFGRLLLRHVHEENSCIPEARY